MWNNGQGIAQPICNSGGRIVKIYMNKVVNRVTNLDNVSIPGPLVSASSGTQWRIKSPLGSIFQSKVNVPFINCGQITWKRTFKLWVYGLNILKYGQGSAPVLAHHCHPPLFEARSPSISFSMKYCHNSVNQNFYQRTKDVKSPSLPLSNQSWDPW